jgi:hypothetical protein
MLCSHRFRFIYTKTMKTGGTSVESYFEPCCMPEGTWQLSHERDEYVSDSGIIGYRGADPRPAICKWYNHLPASTIREQLGPDIWDDYFKFCVIRNPFEKAVSAFYFFRSNGSFQADPADSERTQFERWLEMHGVPDDRNVFMIDGAFCLDDVVRHESLESDMARICSRLGIPWNPEAVPRFKAEIRPAHAKVDSLYTPKTREIVAAAYSLELKLFEYSFPRRAA